MIKLPDLRSNHVSSTRDSNPMDIIWIIDVGVGGDEEPATTDVPKKRSDIEWSFHDNSCRACVG